MTAAIIEATKRGLYCPAGGFVIDPWRPVERAVITHGHGDHARPGSSRYLCAESGRGILRWRHDKTAGADTLETLRGLMNAPLSARNNH